MSKKNKGGRPTVMTPDVLRKLEDAFSYSATDLEACQYAGISKTTLYEYQEKNPKFTEHKEALKISPNLRFKKTIIDNSGVLSNAHWWAEHKMNDEFNTKTKIEVSDTLDDMELDPDDLKAAEDFNSRLKENMIKRRLSRKKV